MVKQTNKTHDNILSLIGNSPIVKLNRITEHLEGQYFVKYEAQNPGHSSKDRIAIHIIEKAEKDGLIKPGDTIVETTSGNTGFSVAMAATIKGYKCILAVSSKSSKDKIDLLKTMGAEVHVCPSNVAPDDPRSYYEVAKRIHRETPNSIYINQYFNKLNTEAHYLTTGPEIWEQTGGKITHLVACSGTGGTISGTAKYLKEQNPNIKILGIDAYGSVLKKYHETGKLDKNEIYSYKIEGLGKNLIPTATDFEVIDKFTKVTDKESALMARKIAVTEGMFVGYTSGAAMQGTMQLYNEGFFNKDSYVVVVFPDHGSRYMSKIYSDDWMKAQGFLDSKAELKKKEEVQVPAKKKIINDNTQTYRKLNIMKDLFSKIYRDKGPLGKWADQAEGYFVFPKLEGEINNRMKFQGREVITWSVNDYLGLANHPEVRKADAEAVKKYGNAYPMGARMMSGHTDLHEKLETELADFVKKEAAYVLNFGYQGILSTIDALVGKDDVIVYDVDAHACIIDGVRLHLGKRFTYKHNDLDSIELNLARAEKIAQQTGGGVLFISEGVFGMRGEQGKLKEIVALKEKYNFRLLVDDAHGFGTLGATGAGAGEEQGVQDGIDVYFATFAKSMASTGAFIAADKEIIDYLKYNMRSQMFAKSLQMSLVEGALKRLEMIKTMPELKNKLWENVNALQGGLKERGFDIGTTTSCVTPVYLKGSIPEAMALVKDLRENYGIFCSIVVYPVIPKGLILLRMIPTSTHTLQDVEETLEAFSSIREKLHSGVYKRIAQAIMKDM